MLCNDNCVWYLHFHLLSCSFFPLKTQYLSITRAFSFQNSTTNPKWYQERKIRWITFLKCIIYHCVHNIQQKTQIVCMIFNRNEKYTLSPNWPPMVMLRWRFYRMNTGAWKISNFKTNQAQMTTDDGLERYISHFSQTSQTLHKQTFQKECVAPVAFIPSITSFPDRLLVQLIPVLNQGARKGEAKIHSWTFPPLASVILTRGQGERESIQVTQALLGGKRSTLSDSYNTVFVYMSFLHGKKSQMVLVNSIQPSHTRYCPTGWFKIIVLTLMFASLVWSHPSHSSTAGGGKLSARARSFSPRLRNVLNLYNCKQTKDRLCVSMPGPGAINHRSQQEKNHLNSTWKEFFWHTSRWNLTAFSFEPW